jgi:hypothetical protein
MERGYSRQEDSDERDFKLGSIITEDTQVVGF